MDPTVVTASTRLWSEECAIADAVEGAPLKPKEPAYEFTGRTYYQRDGNPYLAVGE